MEDQFNVEDLESSIADMQEVDEFNSSVDYENFIVLNKKELVNFCRLCEPLTKSSIDDYGKSVLIKCIDHDTVELRYVNAPYAIVAKVSNKSGKQVKPFAVLVSTLKKLVTNAFASLILVEQDGEMNIALCESLLYLDTKPLKESQYEFTQKATEHTIDKELAIYTFRKVGASLSLTDRASEKTIVVKNGQVNFNTGVFASKSKSPFSSDHSFVLYKQVSDVVATLAELSKAGVNYSIDGDVMALQCDGNYYAEVQIGNEEKVEQFLSATAEIALKFDATISIINDNLLRIISIVKSLEYLSDIVTLSFSKTEMQLTVTSANQGKKSTYKFNIVDGAPEVTGDMKLTVDVLQMFLNITGNDVQYSFTENGLGIKTELGNFLIRKS